MSSLAFRPDFRWCSIYLKPRNKHLVATLLGVGVASLIFGFLRKRREEEDDQPVNRRGLW